MKPFPEISKINAVKPETGIIESAAEIVRNGGLVIFPTRCLYGLGASAVDFNAIRRVFQAKARPAQKPLLLLMENSDFLADWVTEVPPIAKILMEQLWPGRLTIVFPARAGVPAALTGGSGKIGIRIPEHPVAKALVRSVGSPITGTSANISGEGGCRRVSEIEGALLDSVDGVLDAGPLAGGAGSTVVEIVAGRLVVLREGAVSRLELEKMMPA